MMKPEKMLKPRQLSAIQLLALGTPAYQVAERLEVSAMTIHRWQRLPEFESKLHSIVDSGLDELARKINIAALTAVETLQEILCDMTVPCTFRLRAAIGVLNAMPRVNGVLEKSLQHRAADFDLRKRFSDMPFTYNSSGNLCQTVLLNSYQAHEEDPSGGVLV